MIKYLFLIFVLLLPYQSYSEDRQLPLFLHKGMTVKLKGSKNRQIFVYQESLDHFFKNYGYPAPIDLERATNISIAGLSNFELILKNCNGIKIINCSSYTITDLGGNKNIKELKQ